MRHKSRDKWLLSQSARRKVEPVADATSKTGCYANPKKWRNISLVDLSIAEGKLTLHVRGADKLWAFKSTLEIPLAHIAGVRADPEAARGWYHGIRMPGTNVPGVITAGTFYQDGKRVFWDVHHPDKTIVIDLHDERYSELFVEVDDPEQAVRLIQTVL
jgi:hypothetical protein